MRIFKLQINSLDPDQIALFAILTPYCIAQDDTVGDFN